MDTFREVMSKVPGWRGFLGEHLKVAALLCGLVIIPTQVYYILYLDQRYYEDFRDFELLYGKYVLPPIAWLISLYLDVALAVMAVGLLVAIWQFSHVGVSLFVCCHLLCYAYHLLHWCWFLYGWYKKDQETHWWSDRKSEKPTLDYINYLLLLWLGVHLFFFTIINSYYISMAETTSASQCTYD